VYLQKGEFQLYVNDLRPAGLGALAAELEARKARLAADGLLDPRRKRALPLAPKVVGVATSLQGAALQDFLRVSGERYPATRILVAHCTVQGPLAPSEIMRAVELLLEDGRAEVIVVTRGGGSTEDLSAFQDEQLARFLANSPVPVVAAIGHEVDETIADLVADVSVPTPTAAAVRVLPDGAGLLQATFEAEMRLARALDRGLEQRRFRVEELRRRLRDPVARLSEVKRSAMSASRRADLAIRGRLDRAQRRVAELEPRLARAAARALETRRARVVALEGRLLALSPRAVLERGYAVVRGPGGLLRSPAEVEAGDALVIELAGGVLGAQVVKGD
jgi:exodeoxyribonuclease VII large subunit